jgi:hypothetical protein
MGSGPGVRTLTVVRELARSSRRRQFEQQLLLGDEDLSMPIEIEEIDRVLIIYLYLLVMFKETFLLLVNLLWNVKFQIEIINELNQFQSG